MQKYFGTGPTIEPGQEAFQLKEAGIGIELETWPQSVFLGVVDETPDAVNLADDPKIELVIFGDGFLFEEELSLKRGNAHVLRIELPELERDMPVPCFLTVRSKGFPFALHYAIVING